MPRKAKAKVSISPRQTRVAGDRVLQDMLGHFRRREEPLRREWVKEMETGGYLRGGTSEELETDSVAIYHT
jgi:hypothetical protein